MRSSRARQRPLMSGMLIRSTSKWRAIICSCNRSEAIALTAEESGPLLAAANEFASASNCELVGVGEHWFLLSES